MTERKIPNPIIDKKEEQMLAKLTKRYEKLVSPSILAKAGSVVGNIIPQEIRTVTSNIQSSVSEYELYQEALKIISDGFQIVEKQAARFTISEKSIIEKVNKSVDYEIVELDDVCFIRSYKLEKIVNHHRNRELSLAFVEGGTTGVFGFAGLPFNLVLSIFLYYRAVQSIAMFYGYDIKNNPEELLIAGGVFMNAMNPTKGDTNEMTSIIAKIMMITETTVVKQTAKKTWTDMATRSSTTLLLAQMRALAHKSAQKALEKAGAKGLERSVFKSVFEQIGKKLTLKMIQRAVPFVSAGIGALFDTHQMNVIVEYADIFYHKRFLDDKSKRILSKVNTHELIL